MKDRTPMRTSRLELADFLEKVSEQLKAGMFESEGRQWSIPEEIFSGIKIKEKKGYIKARIEWAWPTESEYTPQAKVELSQYRDSFKSVKKRLNTIFKQVRQATEAGRFPEEQLLAELTESSRVFAQMLDPDRGEAMQIYLDHLENLQRSTSAKDLEAVRHEVRDLASCMVNCHREFKYMPEQEGEIIKL